MLEASRPGLVLIESDWNLKFEVIEKEEVKSLVLIESDWNLKLLHLLSRQLPCCVLIESDWNLKNCSIASDFTRKMY